MHIKSHSENKSKDLWTVFCKRYQKARQVADLWASVLEACYFYAIPYRNRFYQPKEQQGDIKGTRVYDTTAVEATKTFVSKLHDAMTPPQVQWGYLELDETFDLEEEVDKTQISQILNSYMRRLFTYIHESNFDVVINECYFDLAVGTSCIVINQFTDEQPLLFSSVPIDKLAIEEAMTGKIESWYRTWEGVKISEIKLRWKNAKLTTSMALKLSQDPNATINTLYEGVMYVPGQKKPYVYMVGTKEEPCLCEEFESNPGIVWRFQKVNSEVFGRGPVMDALPSIISLNELARIELASANLNVFRPIMAFNDAVFNPHTFRLEPFSVIPISPISAGGQAPIMPLPDTSNPQFAQLTITDLRNQIKSLLFNHVEETSSIQPRTASEVMIEQQNLAQRIGPLFSRLQQEFLWPVIKRCAYVLDKMGILPWPEIEGVKIKFRYRSPLSLAKGQQDISRFTQYYQLMQGVFGAGPALMYINPALAPYLIAEQMQVDPRYLNTPEGVQQASQEAQNMQDEMMMSQEGADVGQEQ